MATVQGPFSFKFQLLLTTHKTLYLKGKTFRPHNFYQTANSFLDWRLDTVYTNNHPSY